MTRDRCFMLLSRMLLTLVVCAHVACTRERTWTDNTGNFTIRAHLQEVRPNSVILRLPDGKTREVPLARLSAADRAFLSEHKRSAGFNPDVSSAPSYVTDFYAEVFSKATFGSPAIIELARGGARIVPDAYKPIGAFPTMIVLSIPFLFGGGIWILVRTFKDSKWKGAALIFLNLLSSVFMPLELLRWAFLIYLLFSNCYYFRAPVFLQGFGYLLVVSGFLLAFESLIPVT